MQEPQVDEVGEVVEAPEVADEVQVDEVDAESDDAESDAGAEGAVDDVQVDAGAGDASEVETTPARLTLADVVGELRGAIQGMADNGAEARQTAGVMADAELALANAREAHATALARAEEWNGRIRSAAQSLVDFVTAEFLTAAE